MDNVSEEQRCCADEGADDGELLFAEFRSQLGNKGGQDQHHAAGQKSADGDGRCTVEVVRIDVVVHAGQCHLYQQEDQCGDDDADEGTVGEENAEQLEHALLLLSGLHLDTLCGEMVANHVDQDRQNGANAGCQHNLAAAEHLMSFRIRRVHHHRQNNHDDDLCYGCADGSPVGEHRSLLRLVAHGRCHGAVRDVDARVAYRAPEDVGEEHPEHLKAHRLICKIRSKNKERGHGHRSCKAAYPRSELTLCGIGGAVYDLSHRNIGKGIHNLGDHHQCADKSCADAHDVRVEFHHEQSGDDEGQVIGEITCGIADLVPDAKGSFGILLELRHNGGVVFFTHLFLSPFLYGIPADSGIPCAFCRFGFPCSTTPTASPEYPGCICPRNSSRDRPHPLYKQGLPSSPAAHL